MLCSGAAGVPLDLQEAGWAKKLLAAGFSPEQPTVWVLEGLLYYLEPETVPAMLQVRVSPPRAHIISPTISDTHHQELHSWKMPGICQTPRTTDMLHVSQLSLVHDSRSLHLLDPTPAPFALQL